MKYTDYSLEDLIRDENFKNWVKHPDEESDRFWNDWLAKHPEKRALVEEARQMILLIHFKSEGLSSRDADSLWEQISRETSKKPTLTVPVRRRQLFRWAAVFLLLLGSGALILYWKNTSNNLEFRTGRGETKSLLLPDQSEVILNANSVLKYSAAPWSTDKPRRVWLDGEAFFQISSQPLQGGAEFVVHTTKIDVQVLGTAFMVSSNPSQSRVILQSGKVRLLVKNTQSEVEMKPGEMAEVDQKTDLVQKKTVEVERYLSWKEQQWALDNTPLAEIASRIEEKHQVKVRFADSSLARVRLSGSLPANELDKLLEVLRETAKPIKIKEQKDGTIIISQ